MSSEVLRDKKCQPVYLNDSLLPAAILVSGNNYEKFGLFVQSLRPQYSKQKHFHAVPETLCCTSN